MTLRVGRQTVYIVPTNIKRVRRTNVFNLLRDPTYRSSNSTRA